MITEENLREKHTPQGKTVAAVELRGVYKAYGEKTVIQQLDLKVAQGEFVTVIGSSGCGKTTLLKMINGLILPDRGQIFVAGKDLQQEDLIALRRNIGYAIQGSVLFPHLTVEQNIAYVPNLLNRKNKKRTQQAVRKWLRLVGLEEDMLQRYPDELSGGQQQRVGIARSLAASPNLLLMDEPFGAVDEITREQLQKELKQIHQQTGITILFVTHDSSEALKLGTKVLVMDSGTVQQYDTPGNLLRQPANSFVKQLVTRERRICHLPEDQLAACEYSGAVGLAPESSGEGADGVGRSGGRVGR